MSIFRFLIVLLCASAFSCGAYAQSSGILIGTSTIDETDFPLPEPERAGSSMEKYDSLLDALFFTLFDRESPIREDGLTLMKRTGFVDSRYTLEVNLQSGYRSSSALLDAGNRRDLFSTVQFSLETPLP